MNSKQVLAAASAVVLIVILVYPAISTGTLAVHVRSAAIKDAEHVYMRVKEVWAHRAGQPDSEAWDLVTNQSQTIDLISIQETSVLLGKVQLSLGHYDAIRMTVSNVTWVFNGTSTDLQLEFSELYTQIEFTIQAGRESVITLTVGGHQEEVRGARMFIASVNSTLTRT